MISVRFLAALCTVLLLGGCVVTQQDLQMQRDLLETKRRLDEAERVLRELQADAAGGVRAQVETLSRNQADFQSGLDSVRVDVQSLQGRAGDQARVNDDLQQEITLLRDELRLQLNDHDQRLARLETAPPAATVAPQAGVTPAPVSPSQPAVADTPTTPSGESAAELYDRALKTLRTNQNFAEGRALMDTFLKRYPKDPLAVNAAYWIGEAHYAEKSYDKAILQFEDVIQDYGEHPKVASAMLKQAFAFEAIGDKTSSRLLLQRVIERFPLSEEAKRAREKLGTR